MRSPLLTALLLAACLSPAGCALTSKAEPVVARYYSPEPLEGRAAGVVPAAATPRTGAALELRLGHVDHASYLDDRMVFRDSAYELGYYEERRWTESPDEYLKHALNRVLFEDRGVRRVIVGSAPTLELELTAFDEIRTPPHRARVQVTAVLQDQRAARWVDTFTVEQPIGPTPSGDAAGAVAAAFGRALRAVVAQVADRTIATLEAPAETPPAAKAAR